MKALNATESTVRLAMALAVMSLVGAACGGDDSAATADSAGGADSPVQTDDGSPDEADATAAGDETGDEVGDVTADVASEEPGRTTGRFFSGETYDDGEFRATYRGLAQIPVGPDVFEGGACYAPIFDVTYLDPAGFGSDEFRPSLDAYLDDGTTATADQTGVGCDASVLEPAGYVWLNDTTIEAGQTVTGHLSAFHLASGIISDLDIITIYGGLPSDGGFDPLVTVELRSPTG